MESYKPGDEDQLPLKGAKPDLSIPAVESSFRSDLTLAHGPNSNPTVELVGEASPHDPIASSVDRLQDHGRGCPRYESRGEIGRGGMGAVFKVFDTDLRRSLALKVILGHSDDSQVDPHSLGRFLEEAQVTGQLDHPGIVPVHELGIDGEGRVYFTMRLVRGRDLRKVFTEVHREGGEWTRTRALGALLKVCEAMAYAHDKGVVHRDLKPSNVMVGKYGEVYVMDWGLARVSGRRDSNDLRIEPATASLSEVSTARQESRDGQVDSPVRTMDGTVVGTPAYMSPEQARGHTDQVGPRSDVYSVGAILYELLTDRPPFVPKDARVSPRTLLMRVLEGPPRPLREIAAGDVPVELEAICEKAMERNPAARYPDMGAMANDLRAYLEGRVVEAYAKTASHAERIWRGMTRETRYVEIMGLWGRVWVWSAVTLFSLCAATSLMTIGGVETAWPYVLLWTPGAALLLAVAWFHRFRNGPPLAVVESQLARVWALFAAGILITGLINHIMGFGALKLMPIAVLECALAFGCMALLLGGSFYVITVSCAALALLLAKWPEHGPLLFGLVVLVGLLVPGLRYSRK